jgi:TldD protein
MLTRRTFVGSSAGALAATLFAAPKSLSKPSPDLEHLAAAGLREAKRLKATYCDVRIGRYRNQSILFRATPERGTGKTLEVPNVFEDSSFGFGVRVVAKGAWGFASSPIVTPEEIVRITGEAVAIAHVGLAVRKRSVRSAGG